MGIYEKLIFIISLQLFVPCVVAYLFIKIDKYDRFDVAFLYSFLAPLVMIAALEGLGNSLLKEFILKTDMHQEDFFLYSLRITSLYVLASLGGAPFISKAYSVMTGQDIHLAEKMIKNIAAEVVKVSENVEQIKGDVTKVEERTDKVVELQLLAHSTENEKILELLQLINSSPTAISCSNIPDSLVDFSSDAVAIGAITTKIDIDTSKTYFVLTPLGTKILSEINPN